MTKQNQLRVGLLVCETVLEALIRTHPDKEALRTELAAGFAALEQTVLTAEEPLGAHEHTHMQMAMNAFLWQLDDHRKDRNSDR